ncbi:hypothetical protein RR46_05212 [Papilio xuthus]|uniref:Secapin n=1 Tax=Papilio xuthus TaxID=66420 RepID=A0A194Q903_PAPXU|nr:hypothetical protein RR46_05212 [Papilio xuthus]
MDAKIVLFVVILSLYTFSTGQSGIVFNFHEKLRMATTSTTERVKSGQIIRVPVLECPDGQRRDHLDNCKQPF